MKTIIEISLCITVLHVENRGHTLRQRVSL